MVYNRGPSSHTRNSWIRLAPVVKIPHCCLRRSLGHVSSPSVAGRPSDQLELGVLVSRYLTNRLISHRPLRSRGPCGSPSFFRRTHAVLANLSAGCPHERTRSDVLLTRSPLVVGAEQAPPTLPFDFACVKRSASVQSE